MNNAAQPIGTLEVALGHAARLLEKDPNLAAEQAEEILKALPGHPHARLILGTAYRHAGHTARALQILGPLATEQPRATLVHIELAVALGEAQRTPDAIASLRRAISLSPSSVDAWRLLAEQLDLIGDETGADRARAAHIKAATKDPRLMEPAAALVANDLPVAEALLRKHLKAYPTDVAALRMFAEVAARLKRLPEAQVLLERCLQLAPSFDAARHNYAIVLNKEGKAAAALPHVDALLAKEPRNLAYQSLKAAVLANGGDYGESIEVYEAVLKDYPNQPKLWMSYGHSLKTQRRLSESIAAYRRSIALLPTLGESYWSLANLKTLKFTVQDVQAMRAALASEGLCDDDRLHFEFALGKALEDERQYEESFHRYAAGNAIRSRLFPHDLKDSSKFVERSKAVFTKDLFDARKGWGEAARDPIFIVGLPRAGSTLIEQILASHTAVEGTMELPDLPRMASEIFRQEGLDSDRSFAQAVAQFSAEQIRVLGQRYLADTRAQRKTAKPFFIDKMPNNFLFTGLIALMLPNARIIDARRHPMGCCFSGFKQHFSRGQTFTYSLQHIGSYYRDYVELMAHFDFVLPQRVLRVHHEAMIEDTEAQVRRLLDFCGLPFEDACLKFYENERAVRTASSEQVRQPVFREGMDQWRNFEPWLGPLKEALGDVLDCYPGMPQFASTVSHLN